MCLAEEKGLDLHLISAAGLVLEFPHSDQRQRITPLHDSHSSLPNMTGHDSAAASYNAKHFNITFPREYVAHVETNRADKLNSFFEEYVI